MSVGEFEFDTVSGPAAKDVTTHSDPVRAFVDVLPRPVRFLSVGGCGLVTDLAIFTLIIQHTPHPLLARLLSLAAATLVTWRLNRALTFDDSGRRPAEEAIRYASVTAVAQGTSYTVFALLVVTVLSTMPQLAVIIGAVASAVVSYSGQALFTFRPRRP